MISTVFKVPNTEEGKEWLKQATKFLNKDDFKIVKRGRNPNRVAVALEKGLRRDSFHQDIPIRHSTYFAVYIHQKRTERTERHISMHGGV